MTTSGNQGRAEHAPDELEARLTALRRETAELEDELGVAPTPSSDDASASGAPQPTRSAAGGWWRTAVATVCIIAATVAAPLAVVATWAHDQVSDTGQYVKTVAPLAQEPAVQAAVSTRISD